MFKFFPLVFLIVSCSTVKEVIRPYRVSLGVATKSAEFKDKESGRKLCVTSSPNGEDNSCGTSAFQTYKDNSTLDIGYETKPQFFYKNFSSSFFITYSNINTTLIDYPIRNSNDYTHVRVSRYALNPFIYYNFGDKYFIHNQGLNLRFGIGLSVNYLNSLEVTRVSTGEKIDKDNDFDTGWASLIEINWNIFYIRFASSNINANIGSFSGVPQQNELEINQTTFSIGMSYYFDKLGWYDALWE